MVSLRLCEKNYSAYGQTLISDGLFNKAVFAICLISTLLFGMPDDQGMIFIKHNWIRIQGGFEAMSQFLVIHIRNIEQC